MKAIRKLATWSILLVVVLFVLGEAFARIGLGLGDPPLSITDPEIEYMFKPNQDCKRFGNRIFINEWGMRSMPISKTKQDKTEVRILWFGDSVINGGNQTDHDSLATTLLENELKKKWNKPVRVMNVSAGSWGPPNMLAFLKKHGDFDADIVIITVSSHDAQDYPTFEILNPNTHPTKKPFSALLEGVERYLPRYLPSLVAATTPELDYKTDPNKEKLVLDGFATLLEMERNKGKRVIVLHHWEQQEFVNGVMTGRDSLKNRAIGVGVEWLSDSTEFVEFGIIEGTSFRDNIHPNVSGHLQFMRKILRKLCEPIMEESRKEKS